MDGMRSSKALSLLACLTGLAGSLVAACSSSGLEPASSGGPAGPQPVASGRLERDDTWFDGKQIKGEVTIPDFVTITIAEGATVKCENGAKIIVQGNLRSSAKNKHAKISCKTWQGIVVAQGGALISEGLDLENPDIGITTQAGLVDAKWDYGVMTGAQTPFLVGPGSVFNTTGSKITALGQSEVQGDFIASRMEYNKGGSSGISIGDPNGTITIEDSVLKGPGNLGEFIDSSAGKQVKVSYTTIESAHCAFHFDNVDTFLIDHVTATKGLVFGAMLYGSKTGGKIQYSNLGGAEAAVDVQGTNGALTFDHVYMAGKEMFKTSQPTITNRESGEVAGAKPR